jgi:hypothetical protein
MIFAILILQKNGTRQEGHPWPKTQEDAGSEKRIRRSGIDHEGFTALLG